MAALAELGWLPASRWAWGFGLWRYLPRPALSLFGLALLSLASSRVRGKLAGAAERLGDAMPAGARGRFLLAAAATAALWLLRERRLYGDSAILLYNAAAGNQFLVPDIGASYLFHLSYRVAATLGVSGQSVLQAAVAACGGLALWTFLRVGEQLAPTRRRGLLVTAFVLGGGFLRILAGHVEVYAFVLTCAGVYFANALACLHGRGSRDGPALALGVGIWLHLSFLFLAPSLLLLSARAEPRKAGGTLLRRWLRVSLIAASPTLAFLALMWLLGHSRELAQAGTTLLRWSGLEASPVPHEAFLRLGAAGPGTRYAIGSAGHLKYLANAFFLLSPGAFPLLLGFLVVAPRRFLATPEARLLGTATAGMLVYAAIVRPVWGPYDWDLFTLTAAAAACLAGHLLATIRRAAVVRHLGVLLLGSTLLLVTVPLLVLGIFPGRPRGPFAYSHLEDRRPGETPPDALERRLGPWL